MGPKKRGLSQPAASSHTKSKNTKYSSTQPSVSTSFCRVTNDELNDQANDLVRYMIFRGGTHLPLRKTDLQKHIKGAVGRNFDKILEIASGILEKVYGFKVVLCDGGSKFYCLSNNLPYVEENNDIEQSRELPNDRRKILLMLILTHIFMSRTIVNQASLYSFLKSLQIDPEERHEVFGDVKDYINVLLVKQHYLKIDKNMVSQEISYFWGERSEKEISKMELLNFVCKVFKSQNPKAWVTQFKEADEQPIENHRNINTKVEDEEDLE